MSMVKVVAAVTILVASSPSGAGAAESVMVQCGREYQAARSAGTLDGADWNAYRVACAERVKAGPAASVPAPPVATARPAAPASAPATAVAPMASTLMQTATPAPKPGMAAMHARQKQCGAEWTAGKATLVAQAPGLTWPKYWSQCNTRIKATGR